MLIHVAAEEALADNARRLAPSRACGPLVLSVIVGHDVQAFTLIAVRPTS